MTIEFTPRDAGSAPASPPHGDGDGFVRIRGLSAGFGEHRVLTGVSLDVPAGQTFVIVGESGCGKTTILRAIAGLIPIVAGEIVLAAQDVSQRLPRERGVIYLDQEPLLFEHLTVIENIGFALRLKRVPASAIQAEVDAILAAIDLTSHGQKREWQLSGGQKQRVAFARAVLARPQLLLLDEPFGSLDAKTRGQMQSLFFEVSRRYGLTSIFVTHDVKEALTVGDRFARMSDGGLTVYRDRAAFVNAPETGIRSEIAFWEESARLLDDSGGGA